MIMYTGSFREVCSHCSLELLTVVDKSVNTMCCGPFREMKSLQLSRPQILKLTSRVNFISPEW